MKIEKRLIFITLLLTLLATGCLHDDDDEQQNGANQGNVLITSISQSVGTAGTTIIINGQGFIANNTQVTFDDISGDNIRVLSPNQIIVEVPNIGGDSGRKNVIIRVSIFDNASSIFTGQTDFVYASLAITAINPNQGIVTGGTTITLTGDGFQDGARVLVGGNPATDVVVNSFTQITAKTPAGTIGKANVMVLVGTSAATLIDAFTYTAASQIYWTDVGLDKVQKANSDGTGVEDIIATGLDNPNGIAIDKNGGKIYWADSGTDRIQRANLDGTGVENLVTTGLDLTNGIDIDANGGKIYWVDSGTDRVQRANLDGTGVENLVTTGLSVPTGIALDLNAGKIYWTDRVTKKIQRANLDGSTVEDILTGLDSPVGIVVDVNNAKIYWGDIITKKIQRANLDGTGVEDVVTGLGDPIGITLDANDEKIYWVDSVTKKIQRANLDGTGLEDIITTGIDIPQFIDIINQP